MRGEDDGFIGSRLRVSRARFGRRGDEIVRLGKEEEEEEDDDDDDMEMEVYEKLDAGCEEGGDEGKERRGDEDESAQNTNCHDKEYPKLWAENERRTRTANETPTHDYSTKRQSSKQTVNLNRNRLCN